MSLETELILKYVECIHVVDNKKFNDMKINGTLTIHVHFDYLLKAMSINWSCMSLPL